MCRIVAVMSRKPRELVFLCIEEGGLEAKGTGGVSRKGGGSRRKGMQVEAPENKTDRIARITVVLLGGENGRLGSQSWGENQ